MLACTALLGACLADLSTMAQETKPAEKKEAAAPAAAEPGSEGSLTNYNNWLELSAGGLFVGGNDAAFRQRHMIREGAFGGLEDLHFERKVGKEGLFQLDGRALFDNHDYFTKLELVSPEVGFLRAGYKQFRTWSDGSGGFFPATGTWFSNGALGLDRGEAWFEGGLTLKKAPVVTFKYMHQFRDGEKDSTSWGSSHPGGSLPARGIVPSFWDIDEKNDIFQGDLKYTVKKTDLGLGVRFESGKNDDALKIRQFPNEAGQSFITSREGVQHDLFNVHAFSETRLSKKALFSVGVSYVNLDTELSGNRIAGNDFDVGFNPALANSLGFTNLHGGGQMNEYVANLNFMYVPIEAVSVVPSIRVRQEDLNNSSGFTQTGPLIPTGPVAASSDRDMLDVSERLEARYTGITNWVFYARGDWTEGQGDLREDGGLTLSLPILRDTEDTRFDQKYTLGATWYPLRWLNLDAQYYHKMRDNDSEHEVDSTPNNSPIKRYPAYLVSQDFTTDDANVRATLRPRKNVTLVSRFDFQHSTIDTQPDPLSGLGETESARMHSYIFAQNATWTPWTRLYLQAGFNYVRSETETPASQFSQAVLDSQNNYWTLSFNAGFVLDKKTDLQANYFYYQADNSVNEPSFGVPYGVGAREHGVIVGMTRRLLENLRLNLKYGYFNYEDESGGNNDYDAHMVYASLQYRF